MTAITQRSFTSGELAPGLRIRVDLGKYATGLNTCKNFIVRAQGGVSSRPGTRFVGELGDSSKRGRLIEFAFNTEQTYALIFEDLTMRVVKNGGYVVEATKAITAISQANPAQMTAVGHSYATGDEVQLAAIVGMTELNGRTVKVTYVDANNVTLNGIDSTGYTAYTSGGTSARIYEIATPYLEADLPLLKFTQSADVMTLVHNSYDDRDLSRLADDNWTLAANSYAPTTSVPTSPVAAAVGTGGGTYNKDYQYVITAIGADDSESLASAQVAINTNSLSTTYGVRLTWTAVSGAKYYKIYKSTSKDTLVYGWIGESKIAEFTDFNIAPDSTLAPPEDRTPFTGADNRPGVVNYYQQRKVFANTTNEPQTMFATQTANYKSLRTSSPARTGDAVTLTVAARQVNEIRHIVALDAMILMTSGGEWLVTEGQDEVLAPDTVGVKIQSYNGCSHVPPAIINDTVVFVQEKGSRVRDLGYTFTSDKYVGNDLSIMSEHFFENNTIEEMTYAYEPYGVLWCVRDDGVLLGMTYQKEHEVWGWHQHDTDGLFESVTSVAEGSRDAVYVIVKRTIDGNTVRYIERMETREETTPEDCFYVDSGLSYDGVAATVITGLFHLEGETVIVLADGNVVEDLVVVGGSITLPEAASKVHVGMYYEPELVTLGVDSGERTLKGAQKNIGRVDLHVYQSRGGWIGPVLETPGADNDLLEIKPRFDTDGYDTLALKSFDQTIRIQPGWSQDGKVRVVQRSPLPLTILGITPDIDLGG